MQEKYVVFATIQDTTGNITSYRLFNVENRSVRDIPRNDIKEGVSLIFDAEWDNSFKGLVSTSKVSISKLPVVEEGTHRIKSYGGIFLYELVVDSNNAIIGAVVYDTNGARGAVTYDSLLTLLTPNSDVISIMTINFEVGMDEYNRRTIKEGNFGYKVPRRVLDEYKSSSFRVTDAQSKKDKTGIVQYKPDEIPVMPVYSLSEAASTMFNTQAGNKLLNASANLKVLAPYYWVLLSTINKRPCLSDVVSTMGVTENTLYYNSAFVATCTLGELVFIFIHEIMHIAMCHSARHGKRDHELWNIATDLYINEMIVHDFELVPGVEKQISVKNMNGGQSRIPICAPLFALYFSKIGEVCNLSKDLPEYIYSRLEKENPPSKNGGGRDADSGGDGGKDSDGSGDPFASNDMGGKECKVSFNGKELRGSCLDDVRSNCGHDTEDNKQKSQEQALQKVQDMLTKKKMVEDKLGQELTQGMTGAELLQRMIEYNLNGKTDWRKLLRNICKGRPRKKYTLGSPDETYMNMGITVAGRRRIGKPDKLKGIIFAIDASGSVTDELLSYFIAEVESIFSQYNVDGGLLYWNTKVCSYGHFSKRGDMRRVDSNFTGGTDVKCVFDFITGKNGEDSKLNCDIKAKDIQALFIITDGMFSSNYGEYESSFGKKTMWLLDGNPIGFNPCFGKVTQLSKDED